MKRGATEKGPGGLGGSLPATQGARAWARSAWDRALCLRLAGAPGIPPVSTTRPQQAPGSPGPGGGHPPCSPPVQAGTARPHTCQSPWVPGPRAEDTPTPVGPPGYAERGRTSLGCWGGRGGLWSICRKGWGLWAEGRLVGLPRRAAAAGAGCPLLLVHSWSPAPGGSSPWPCRSPAPWPAGTLLLRAAQRGGHSLGERPAPADRQRQGKQIVSVCPGGGGRGRELSCALLCSEKKAKKFGSQTTNCFAFGTTGTNRHFLCGLWTAEAGASQAGRGQA